MGHGSSSVAHRVWIPEAMHILYSFLNGLFLLALIVAIFTSFFGLPGNFIALGAVALLTVFGPAEKTLGTNVRVVYLHGVWVWTALAAFLSAAVAGLVGLRQVSPGALVSPGDVITTLVDDSQMKLDFTVPSLYLRGGLRDGVHFRTDFLAPDPAPGVTGLFRAGIGFPIGRTRALAGFSAFRGLDLDEASDWGGVFAELEVPLGGLLEASLAGSVHFPEEQADWAVGIGLRVKPR